MVLAHCERQTPFFFFFTWAITHIGTQRSMKRGPGDSVDDTTRAGFGPNSSGPRRAAKSVLLWADGRWVRVLPNGTVYALLTARNDKAIGTISGAPMCPGNPG